MLWKIHKHKWIVDLQQTLKYVRFTKIQHYLNDLRRQNSRPQQTFERWTPTTHKSQGELARQSEAKRKQAPQSEANVGNLGTMTKFTTTKSVDWEKTGTRTSVSARKRKLKMQSVGRSTTTTLNVNANVKLWCSLATKFFAMPSFKIMQDLIF